MSGNTANADVWGGADVLIAPLTADVPVGLADFDMNTASAVITAGITNADATVTGTGFSTRMVGATVTGTGIPGSTTVLSVTDATHFELSANATATNASASLTIGATANGWDFVGLLDGGQGFEDSMEVESTDHEAWGYGVIATTYKGQKTTVTFTSLEDNKVVHNLLYDNAGMVYTSATEYAGDLAVRDHTESLLIGFRLTSGEKERRRISKDHATVFPTSAGSASEESLASTGFTATIIPDENRVLWYAVKG